MINQQIRITRRCLIGTGIVCGLDIYVDEDYGVLVRGGNGITSKGRYLEIAQPCWFRYYRPYENTDEYPFFADVNVWELLKEPDGYPLKPQSLEEEQNPFIKNKVVLIYKEKGNGPIRVLVMEESDLLSLLNIGQIATSILWDHLEDDDDFIYNDDYNPDDTRPRIHELNWAMNPAHRLPEIPLRRLGYSSADPFDCPPEGVDTSVFPEILNLEDLYFAYIPIIDDATRALDGALTELHQRFAALLDWNKVEQVSEWIALLCEKWEVYKEENEEENVSRHYIQYFYGWVRDLIQAYHELRREIIDLVADCCTNDNEFPRHLILGIALRDDLSRQPKPLRHTFRQPPIYNGNADRLQRLRLYCWRVLMMIKEFYLPDYISNPDLNPHCLPEVEEEMDYRDFSRLRVTPSRYYDDPLGEQSVPFYYPLTLSRYSVHHFWNYHRTKTCTTDHILSYHASNSDDSYTDINHVIHPLHFSLHNYPFFRIEGHIGRNLRDYQVTDEEGIITYHAGVENELNFIRQKYNLPLEIVAVHFPLTVPETEPYLFEVLGETEPRDSYISFLEDRFGTNVDELTGANMQSLIGMEHLAGAKTCGTFILVYELYRDENGNIIVDSNGNNNGKVVADFFLPKCQTATRMLTQPGTGAGSNVGSRTVSVESAGAMAKTVPKEQIEKVTAVKKEVVKENSPQDILIENLGKASLKDKDDLTKINGIGPKLQQELYDIQIFTLKQLSKMKDKDYEIVDNLLKTLSFRKKGKRDDWAKQATTILKAKS